jgi:hypothetical protein
LYTAHWPERVSAIRVCQELVAAEKEYAKAHNGEYAAENLQ